MKSDNVNMDPFVRRKLIFSLSQPTNPIPGALLRHIEHHGTPRSIQAWERVGWIGVNEEGYILTEKGCLALCATGPQIVECFIPDEQEGKTTNPGTWLR